MQDNYYAGADLQVEQSRTGSRVPVAQSVTIPRSNNQYTSAPTYQQADSRNTYYPAQPGLPVSSTQYLTQPTDPYYGRGAYNHQPPPHLLIRERDVF